MKSIFTPLARAVAAGAALVAIHGGAAYAVTAGTPINNTVSVAFDVNSQAQTPATDTASFIVDEKIDVTVADGHSGAVTDEPGATVTLTYTVSNTGNKDRDFAITVASVSGLTALAAGSTPTNPGEYAIDDDNIAVTEGGSGTVTLTFIVPATASDGVTYDFDVTATVDDGSGAKITESTTGGLGVEDRVYADGAGSSDSATNGDFADVVTVTVSSATLAASKVAAILDDGLGAAFACNNFASTGTASLAVPGACVEWTITVTNSGSADADDVTIGDTVPAGVSVVAIQYTVNGGSAVAVAATNSISTNIGALPAGQSAEMLVRGVIQ